ncbi:hypothetical protein [Providencia rettgeri]|uniref:hypothetical protein n=1 Tax=Providencia rettgeri TaxID=587 RepID=UPI0018C58C6F|nr:hypothetical protein [Providencia rettgeri]MBG5927307.1 hypothetical protein [Providencia rettgeri]
MSSFIGIFQIKNISNLSLLKDHRFFGENTKQTLEESAQKLNFIRQQMSNILQEQQKHQLELVELQEKATLLQTKIEENMPSSIGEQSQIVLSIDAKKPVSEKKKTINSGIAGFVTTSNNGINLNNQIALPYSLKSTSK